MKKIFLFFTILTTSIYLYAQDNYKLNGHGKLDAYIGTWVYQNKDTVFKIHLSESVVFYTRLKTKTKHIFGNYYLTVKGKVIDDYRGELPNKIYIEKTTSGWSDNICIDGSNVAHRDSLTPPPYIGFIFYDKRKRHFNGKGISGGQMRLMSPDSLYFALDEKTGIWNEIEGSEMEAEPIGFSVPYNIIMRKEK